MSALGSHVGRARSTTGGFSIGASGAVYACFALTAMQRPDTEVQAAYQIEMLFILALSTACF